MNNCIFCKIVRKEAFSDIIDENESIIVITSLENHPLIVTKKHIKDIYELDDKNGAEVMKEAIKVSKAVKKALNCDGINLVQSNETAAGQDVFHFHLHIKPRWIKDDVNLEWSTQLVESKARKEMTERIKASLVKVL